MQTLVVMPWLQCIATILFVLFNHAGHAVYAATLLDPDFKLFSCSLASSQAHSTPTRAALAALQVLAW